MRLAENEDSGEDNSGRDGGPNLSHKSLALQQTPYSNRLRPAGRPKPSSSHRIPRGILSLGNVPSGGCPGAVAHGRAKQIR
jgi:hypothetical protein